MVDGNHGEGFPGYFDGDGGLVEGCASGAVDGDGIVRVVGIAAEGKGGRVSFWLFQPDGKGVGNMK